MSAALSARIALRYLSGRRSANAVPLLSRISMLAIAVGSGAMIVLFSVFNGFEGLVRDLYKSFYPDIRITPATGKFFALPQLLIGRIAHLPGIAMAAPVAEDNVLVSNEDQQVVVTLKGVTNDYFTVNNLRPYMDAGRDTLREKPLPTAIVGSHIAAQMGLDADNDFSRLELHYPNTQIDNPVLSPEEAYRTLELKPDGFFKVQEEFDGKYVLAPMAATQRLFGQDGKITSLELKLESGADITAVQQSLKDLLGAAYKVETRFEQNRTLYTVMRGEKWATYAILVFVLLIASVNMVGALALLVLEKGKDTAILAAMGARPALIRAVFLLEGMLWAIVGGGIGLLLGGLLCYGQQRFGWVKLNGAFIIDAYPVVVQGSDFFVVIGTVIIVGLLAAAYPAWRSAARTNDGAYARLR